MYREVQQYYRKRLPRGADLKTGFCFDRPPPDWLKPGLGHVYSELLPFATQTAKQASGVGAGC